MKKIVYRKCILLVLKFGSKTWLLPKDMKKKAVKGAKRTGSCEESKEDRKAAGCIMANIHYS